MDYRFKSRFVAEAAVIKAPDDDSKVAQAALAPLAKLLPADIDVAANPDLLFISSDGALGGYVNRNGDGISAETAAAIHASAKLKYINLEHERGQVVGVVLNPVLTKRDTHEPLTSEEALAIKEPFNMSFAGAIWRAVSPMVANYISQQGDSTTKDVLSMSWEICFNDYNIAVGSKDISKARVIPASDPSFAAYDKMLRGNGGEGRDNSGAEVYRVICGDAIILGYAIVPNPAAEVKGILPIEKAATPDELIVKAAAEFSRQGLSTAEIIDKITFSLSHLTREESTQTRVLETASDTAAQKSEEKSITPSNVSVTPNTAPSMKIENIEQLQSVLGKHESAAAVVDFVKAIKEASEQFSKDLQAKEDLVKNAEIAKTENEARANKLQASLDTVKKELQELRDAQAAAEQASKFQERMASFNEKFDLDDEDRKLIASDIKGLDDEGFAAYAKKADKLMAAKSKKSDKKAPPFGKKDDKKDSKDSKDDKSDDDDDDDDAKASVKAAVASITEDKDQAKIPNTTETKISLADQMAAAFGNSIKIDGRTVTERKAAKAKK